MSLVCVCVLLKLGLFYSCIRSLLLLYEVSFNPKVNLARSKSDMLGLFYSFIRSLLLLY